MKKLIYGCIMSVFFFFTPISVLAEEVKSQPEEHGTSLPFKLVKQEDLTDIEKEFVHKAKEKKGLYRLGSLYVISLGAQPSSGYGLAIEKQEQQWEQTAIFVKQIRPEKGKNYLPVITYPYIAGKLSLPPYTTFSVLDSENKQPLFNEAPVTAAAKEKRFILDNKASLIINMGENLTVSDMKHYRIFAKKMGENEKEHPVKVKRDKQRKNVLIVKPIHPYEKGESYILYIENEKTSRQTLIPYEVKGGLETIQLQYHFDADLYGWTGHFADLPANYDQESYSLKFNHRTIPIRGGTIKKGLLLSGINRSDDLFMYAKKKIGRQEGLLPNTTYSLEMEISFYTNTDPGLIGAGGAPGESVYVKAGASAAEPKEEIVDGNLRMNIDKGEQASSGTAAVVIGNVAKEQASNGQYEQKTVKMAEPLKATTNNQGELWIFFGTDSGFEGQTTLYYSDIKLTAVKSKGN